MIRFAIGATHVCVTCRLRSVETTCRGCGQECRDLAAEEITGWPGLAQHHAGLSLLSPRGIRYQRGLLVMAATLGLANALAPVIGPWLYGKSTSAADLAAGALCGAVSAPLLVVFYAIFLFASAHVTRVMGVLVGALPLPVFRTRQSVVAWLLDIPARAWIPQIRAPLPDQPAEPGQIGELAAPLTVAVLRDSLSFLERHDAWLVSPLVVRSADGAVHTVDVVRGTIAYPPGAGQRAADEGEVPVWLRVPGRPGVRFRRVFSAGTRLALRRDGDRVDLALS